MKSVLSLLLLCLALPLAAENPAIYPFSNPTDRQRFQQFNEELRCPWCQNQNLAGSDSLVAEDLRREIYEQILDGRSDREITDYLLARYGDYILYKPRLTGATMVLYVAPVIFFISGVVILLMIVLRRRQREQDQPIATLNEQERKRLDKLLEQEKNP